MMAGRYGGKYSPGRQADGTGSAPAAGNSEERRAYWLFVVALPFAVKAFWQEPVGLALNLAAFGALFLAAWLTREGVRATSAYEARHSARRPAIPRKLMATALTSGGLLLGTLASGTGTGPAVLLALAGGLLHFLAFGADPLADKNMEHVDTFQQDRVARIIVEGEAHLRSMSDAAKRSGDRDIMARVDGFLAIARAMFRTVENDPRDLTAARRYLGVYLMGARDATIKFADIWSRSRDVAVRADFEALLTDLETNFAARTDLLLSDDRSDLDVEIDVLRDRLKREGITVNSP